MKRVLGLSVAIFFALCSAAFAQVSVTYGKVEQPWYMQGKISGGISVTSASAATALPTAGFTAWICNTGTVDAYLAFGGSSVTASATTSSWLKASTCANYDLFPPIGSKAAAPFSYVAAITASSTTTLTVETGIGSGPAQLVASGGGGGGGAVFGPTAVGSPAANPPVLVGGTIDGTATGNVSVWKVLAGVGFINCANCSGSGASAVDEATFTPGSPTVFAPAGGFFQTTATNNALTNLQGGWAQMTAQRALFMNLRNSSGTEIGTTAAPVNTALASGSVASGSFASGSISAGAVAAGAFVSGSVLSGAYASGALVDITNVSTPISPNTATATKALAIGGVYNSTQETLTTGQQAGVALSARGAQFVAVGADGFSISNTGFNGLQGGSALSATNGWYTNILQGNAVLSATNPLFVSPATSATWAATQSGTWNITNISGTVSLPTGAATAANQTAVQGTVAAGTAAANSQLGGCVYNSSAPTLTTGQQVAEQCDVNGNKLVKVSNTNNNGPALMSGGSPVTVGGSNSSVPINISTATTTQLVALSGTTKIYVMAWDVIAGGTGNITLEYGTGTNCGTGTTVLTGAYPLTAQAGISKGDGSAPVLVVPAGNALCALTSAAVQMSGSATYQQF